MSESWYTKNREGKPHLPLKERFEQILYTPVTVESISFFADKALNQLITLNENVLEQYKAEYSDTDNLSGRDLEDAAYAAYELPNLNEILTQIITVQEQIQRLQTEVQDHLSVLPKIITPPDENSKPFNGKSTNTYEAPEIKSRLLTLAYILEHDFDISVSETEYLKGITSGDMVRQEPYIRVSVPSLNRLVYVCDEAGNASYIFDTEILEHLGISPADLDIMTKNQRNALLRVTSEAGKRIAQSPKWRQEVSQALKEPFLGQDLNEKITSEFTEKREFLKYEEFKAEMVEAYTLAGRPRGLQKWYQDEYKKHTGWPADPYHKYKNDGFSGYPELVGKEVKEFLAYDEFKTEVTEAYTLAGRPRDVFDWYRKEYKKHTGWPGKPERMYGENGFSGYPELVGKEFLNYDEFKTEVTEAYVLAGRPSDIHKWYQDEYKNHTGWPSSPNKTYRENGFSSYPELVGKEVKEFLAYDEFKTKVTEAYVLAGRPANISKWYQDEYKNHTGWPSQPIETYRENGFSSYPELVGKEFLNYDEFKTEVTEAYTLAGRPINAKKWYQGEYKKHTGWPGKPERMYGENGFSGYPELVGKEVKEFLAYDEFKTEVTEAYTLAGRPRDVFDWYRKEYKKHTGWPSNPDKKYQENGFSGYPELVGKNKK